MKRKFSKAFKNYQKDEEKKVMSLAVDEEDRKRLKQMYKMVKVRKSDMNRVYSSTEVRQLCLRTNLRVNMTLYNCVWEAKQRLDRKNRLTNRSPRFVNNMLVKAVQRRMVIPYTTSEITKYNHIRSCQRKKDNNCRLDRWRHEEYVLQCNQSLSTRPPQEWQAQLVSSAMSHES